MLRVNGSGYRRHHLQQITRGPKAPLGILLEEDLSESNDRLGDALELFERQRCVRMLIHYLSRAPSE
jgi:hypothetical protein